MSDTPDLVSIVRAKRQRLAVLEAEVAQLKSELSAVLQELMPAEQPETETKRRGLVGANTVVMTAEVLRDSGTPLHITQIISRIQQRFGVSAPYTTVVSNLARLVKQGRMFYRAGPNVFGLIEIRERQVRGVSLRPPPLVPPSNGPLLDENDPDGREESGEEPEPNYEP